jgi:membrane-associated phospholipid phosphatase
VLGSFDSQASLWIVGHRVSWLNDVMIGLSALGTLGALWVVLAGALTRKITVAVWVAAVVLATDALAGAARDAIGRPRPFDRFHQVHLLGIHPASPSLPSGHAATQFAGAAFLVVVLARSRALLLLVPAALIALSRVYLGAHYPTDVFAGAGLGLVLGAGAALLEERVGPAFERVRPLRLRARTG